MTRSVKEWIGRTDDTPAPPRVRLRVLERQDRKCAWCGFEITGRFEVDHVQPLILGGANTEGNLQPMHVACHALKTDEDIAAKAKMARVMKAHYGVKPKGRPMDGSRASKFKRKMNGTVERRT